MNKHTNDCRALGFNLGLIPGRFRFPNKVGPPPSRPPTYGRADFEMFNA